MTAYQIPTESEQFIQWKMAELHQQEQQQEQNCSRKRSRSFDQDMDDESVTPPEKTMRLHESILNESAHMNNQQDSGNFINTSKLSRRDILSAYKRIWDNLDLSKPADAKLEPFVWRKIRHYQQNL